LILGIANAVVGKMFFSDMIARTMLCVLVGFLASCEKVERSSKDLYYSNLSDLKAMRYLLQDYYDTNQKMPSSLESLVVPPNNPEIMLFKASINDPGTKWTYTPSERCVIREPTPLFGLKVVFESGKFKIDGAK